MTSKNWITDHTGTHHIDGIRFDRAPLPPRWHRCRPWTIGHGGYGPLFRCACGALQLAGTRRWVGKNSRRRLTDQGELLDRLADKAAENGYVISRVKTRPRRPPKATGE